MKRFTSQMFSLKSSDEEEQVVEQKNNVLNRLKLNHETTKEGRNEELLAHLPI